MAVGKYKRLLAVIMLGLMAVMALSGCSRSNQKPEEQEEEQEAEQEAEKDTQLYMLLYTNADTQKLFLQSVETRRQEEFEYNGGTYIRNQYGDNITVAQLETGELIRISYTEKKVLTEVNLASDAFVYDGITKFHVNTEDELITIGDSSYYYDEALKIFSDGGIISLNDLSEKDTVCMRGLEKQILTIVVEKGHGTIALKNTELFEGGMITIGGIVAQVVTEDLTLELPEGTYRLSVANDGYGGSMDITVNRFEELTVDLNTLKGNGPQFCQLKITPEPPEASVTLNGGAVDCSQLLELKYGTYRLAAEADGYSSWSGNLVVNSSEAAITIKLDKESDTEEEDTEEDTISTEESSSTE